MASITIRNLDDKVKEQLRLAAAHNGRSMEQESGLILGRALTPVSAVGGWAAVSVMDSVRSGR